MGSVEFQQRAQKKSPPPPPPPPPPPTPMAQPHPQTISTSSSFFINDHEDILLEVMKRLDYRSLAVSSCVCRLWRSLTLLDSLWENLVVPSHLALHPDSLRPVVLAMGGYRKLFSVCVRPLLDRLSRSGRVIWTGDDVRLSLSLFSIDCYERLGSRPTTGSSSSSSSSSSSLSFGFLGVSSAKFVACIGARWRTEAVTPQLAPFHISHISLAFAAPSTLIL